MREHLKQLELGIKSTNALKKTRLHVDHVNYRMSRNQVKNLIKREKRNYIKEKLTENIGNSKTPFKL